MQRFEQAGIQLDTCGACHATWFDASEIVAVYGLAPVPSLASWRVSQPDAGLLGSLLGQGAPVGVGSLTLGAALGILRAIR